MSDYFSGDEEFTFPEDERAQTEQSQPGADYGAKEHGFFGRLVGSVKDFFGNPAIDGSDGDESDEDTAEESGFTQTADSAQTHTERDTEIESIWSDTGNTRKQIEMRGVTDMPNISSTSAMYGKPIFAQRTLRDVKSEELWEIVEKMRENTVVMLNLEACNDADADKILTFLSGAACFQQGAVHPNGSRSYVLTPPNAEIDSDQDVSHSNFLPS
ncbi:MAG: cell division protein SepF [Oscillospiraceae bacterium]|jgi:FtsZ-interacting cell division protein YlmF|nr:cell division protein SepF [Oscillospiraceae bacterium]